MKELEILQEKLLTKCRQESILPGGHPYPRWQEVGELTEGLLSLIFPIRADLDRQTVSGVVTRLEAMLSLAAGEARAQELTGTLLGELAAVRALGKEDVEAACSGDPAAGGRAEVILAYPGLFAVTVQRLAHVLYGLGVPLLPRMMTEYAHSRTGIDIHPGADLGRHLFIDHGTGVVIGETAELGNYVKLYQGVTLGAVSTRRGQGLRGIKRHPTLEDGVTVYAGATILGGDTRIGRDSVIGSNAFLVDSVPPGTRVPAAGRAAGIWPSGEARP